MYYKIHVIILTEILINHQILFTKPLYPKSELLLTYLKLF
jgi:hypothetical protein